MKLGTSQLGLLLYSLNRIVIIRSTLSFDWIFREYALREREKNGVLTRVIVFYFVWNKREKEREEGRFRNDSSVNIKQIDYTNVIWQYECMLNERCMNGKKEQA